MNQCEMTVVELKEVEMGKEEMQAEPNLAGWVGKGVKKGTPEMSPPVRDSRARRGLSWLLGDVRPSMVWF